MLQPRVLCWRGGVHVRALAKERSACEALVRIGKIFEVGADIQKGRPPPSKIKALRQKHLAPLVDEFLAFAAAAYEGVKDKRSALGVDRRKWTVSSVAQAAMAWAS